MKEIKKNKAAELAAVELNTAIKTFPHSISIEQCFNRYEVLDAGGMLRGYGWR